MKSKFVSILLGLASLFVSGLALADGLPPYVSPGGGTLVIWLLSLIG
jgi:hypothetical protein